MLFKQIKIHMSTTVSIFIVLFFSVYSNYRIYKQYVKGGYPNKTDSQKYDDSIDRYIAPGRYVCPNTLKLFHNVSSIEAVYKEAENFHNLGGNLKSVETHLNNQIDETLKIQDLSFYSFDNNDGTIPPNTTVPAWVKQLQQKIDVDNSGGYRLSWPPGLILPRGRPFRATKNKEWFKNMKKKYLQNGGELLTMRTMGNKRNQKFDVMEPIDGFQRWKASIGPILDICKNVDRIGDGKGYEDKFMCSFDELITTKSSSSTVTNDGILKHSTDNECNILSIGNNGQWGFENAISDKTTCTTHTFDCTVSDPGKPEKNTIHFYPYCIAAESKKLGDREYVSYSQLVKIAGLSSAPTLLKMDVEGFEYDVMTQMIADATETKSKHELPSQISVELHYGTRMYDLPWLLRLRQAGEIAIFTGMLYRAGGYLPVHVKYMEECDGCAEILFVRVFCDE